MNPLILAADLLFVVGGGSGFSDAITGSTAPGAELAYDHVGIAFVDSLGNTNVIEASPEDGVQLVTLEDFLEAAPRVNGNPGVVVMRLDLEFPQEEAVTAAASHLGEEYDWWYMPDNEKMYCSELVYEAFLDAEGRHIFESAPMNFKNADGSVAQFWRDLFHSLDMEIPQGAEGTNPHDLSRNQNLVEIHRFF